MGWRGELLVYVSGFCSLLVPVARHLSHLVFTIESSRRFTSAAS
jgi:hypothetical protein